MISTLRLSSESEYSDEDVSDESSVKESWLQKYKCPKCPNISFSLKSYNRHLRSHNLCSPYKCKVNFHLKDDHLGHKKEVKAKRQSDNKLRNRHKLEHQGLPYKGPICKETFPLKGKDVKIEPIIQVSHKNISSSESETGFFPRLSDLQEHKLSHQGVLKLEEPLNDKAVPGQDDPLYRPGTVADIQIFGPLFSTENLDKSDKPMLDFGDILHFNWLVKFTLEVKALDLPLPIPVLEKVSHLISLLTIQLTSSTGRVDMGINYQYFASILKTLSSVSSEHFLKLAELKHRV